ncbi:MAG: proprotein convertase P-domain-containing protein [bacterium]
MSGQHARTAALALSATLILLLPLAASARQGAAPFSENGAGGPLGSVQRYFVPARDGVALSAVADERSRTEGTPFQFADPVPTSITPATHGTWETLPDGARLWRLFIDAPGATDLNLGFGRFNLPPGATLHVIAPGRDYYEGPYTGEDATDGQLWLPVTPGSQAVVELYVPPRAKFEPDLELVQVGYGFRDWFHLASPLRQGACNNDVICPVGDPWRDDIHAEAVYQRSGAWTCSGQMVNNTAADFTPYFETANHCGVNAGNAATMVVYWNFESPTCGALCCGSLAQNQTGATWKASYATSDFTLVQLNATPNPDWHVYYAGWDNSGAAVPSVVGIHHPNCDEKAISFENDALVITSYLGTTTPGDGSHWEVRHWESGVTEPGSSGSGIWDTNHRLVGQLHGGYSSCSLPHDPDWYGRVSMSWNGGGTPSSRLKDWLDPLNSGVQTLNGSYAAPPPPSIRLASFAGYDHCPGGVGDANGVWEPGEQVQIPVSLTAAYGPFTSVTGSLATTSAGVTILDGSATWPNIPMGGTQTSDAPHFMIAIGPGVTCGTVLNFQLTVYAAEGGPFNYNFSHEVGQSLTPSGLPGAINDNSTTTSVLTVGQAVTLTDVNVHVQINHTWVGDLGITLQSPLGTVITLLDRPGVPASTNGCNNDNMDITFDDASGFNPETWCPGTTPWYSGPAMPVTPLSALNGQSTAGNWTLSVTDYAGGDVGSLVTWSLNTTPIVTGTCNVCSAATGAPVIAAVAEGFGLAPVRPNPFGSSADISYSLERSGRAKVEVIDVTGRRVKTLVDADMPAGRNAVSWDGRDSAGRSVAAGMYFVRLSSGGRVDMQRVSRLR